MTFWRFTHDPEDPCSLCVQWRCATCKKEVGACDVDAECFGSQWEGDDAIEPYMPDDSVPPRIYRNLHRECADAMYQYTNESRGEG